MIDISGTHLALAAFGGVLIGAAVTLLLATLGRIAGISGILLGVIRPDRTGDMGWRIAFILGLLLAPLVTYMVTQRPIEIVVDTSLPMLIVAGLLVGIGTALGSGCTSGHGVCGIARLSPRSLTATVIFMVVAIVVVALGRFGAGG